ncbi:MAG: endonuclease III [Holosporales bacterium]|jgi:endonuclease-3
MIIADIFARLARENPRPQSELQYTSPFTLLVAVSLSAQATDASVNKATPALFAVAPTPRALALLGEDGIRPYIKTIGLFNSKARNLAAMAHMLVQEYASQVPDNIHDLMRLPGVGRKTANVILNVAFGHPTIAVDTHVFRVSRRLGLSSALTPDGVENDLLRCIPEQYLQHAHHWLILLGRYVCTARKPRCAECVLNDSCPKFI